MSKGDSPHPGAYIREDILPRGLTVSAAAKRLGVGRPALSNLLNGNASLSSDMAVRLEKTFGCDSRKLLQLQAEHDRVQAQTREPAIAVRAYAPSVLAIKAAQIEAWSGSTAAREELAALIRRLVYSTGDGLVKLDFPAFENSERHGWDGYVTAEAATPWIPLGESGWEFGVSQNPQKKAEQDFRARKASVSLADQARQTFVFVTPRVWPGKAAWAAAKMAEGSWKGVRAYDASDLEQWIETSIPSQAFFSNRLPLRDPNLVDLQGAWDRWAEATSPPLSKELFRRASTAAAHRLDVWLKQAPDRPFTVVADSHDEGVAALVCAFEAEPLESGQARERTVVARSRDASRKIKAAAASNMIVILDSADAEEEAGALFRQHHTIVVTHRNSVEDPPDYSVDLADDTTFHEALRAMGVSHGEIERLDRESGRSLTVLRRRLAQMPALRSPPWAKDAATAKRLVPLMMVGAWDTSSDADKTVVEALADKCHDTIEADIAMLVGEADSPLWSIGKMRGVVSKTDAFYAVQRFITDAELHRFFDVAHVVLAEEDPALDLPEDQKWAAGIYGRIRRHSTAVRRSFCETLVLLSVHGENLFRARLGFDVKGRVNTLIRSLLTPLDGATWQSQRHDLPMYAEAAPDVFLDLLDEDLRSKTPKVHSLLQPAGSAPFSSPGRTGLLWALETLAWNPERLLRVVSLLAKLAEIPITDNWGNKPEGSLDSILRCWMPQTAAPVEDRIRALEFLVRHHQPIGWRICLNQFDLRFAVGHYNSKPRWRADAAGAGEPVKWGEAHRFARRAVDLSIDWQGHNEQTLGDLVERLDGIPDDQDRVWEAIRKWLRTEPADAAKAKLREQIRRSTMVRPRKGIGGGKIAVSPQAREIFEALEPQDLIWRHHWLFAQQWVQESADERQDATFDYEKRAARIEKARLKALVEVREKLGFKGILELCRVGDAAAVVGGLLAKMFTEDDARDFIAGIVKRDPEPALDLCLTGLLWNLSREVRGGIHDCALRAGSPGNPFSSIGLHRILLRSPFSAETWAKLSVLAPREQARYWAEVSPGVLFHVQPNEANQAVEKLISAKRPRAAFAAVHLVFSALSTDCLIRLLTDVATVDAEPAGHYRLEPYSISEAFKSLSARPDADPDILVRLEFSYIDGLDHSEHGIPNLERQLSESPTLFVQALAMAFRRQDGGEDPPEFQLSETGAASRRASAAYSLLSRASRLPGTNHRGEIDGRKLRDWIAAVRAQARDWGREEIGDIQIGQLLAHCQPGKDGIWPNETVRNVLEDLGTPKIARGMIVGRQNARGAVLRGEGGAQERDLAKINRDGALTIAGDHPFTARLLSDLADNYDQEAEWQDDRSRIGKRLSSR